MDQLVNFIIRPPRAEYDPNNDLLDQEFVLKRKLYKRKDVEVKNSQGYVLQCSHYVPIVSPEGKPLPCVIYCHGNSGCRADASEAAIILLPSNITVFTLDFSGSGLSEGEHVTLGWSEKNDLGAVVEYLRQDANVSLIGLWGRSMGAVTSLMYGAEDPSIAGMVLDSPFSDLVALMMEFVDTYKIRLPKFTVKFAIQHMRKAILKKAKFDIMDLNTIKVAQSCFVPAFFGHAISDDFIKPHHSDLIFEAYAGEKNIIKFKGDHNSPRPQFYFDSIDIFFRNVLQPPEDEIGISYFDTVEDFFDRDGWNSLHQQHVNSESLVSSKGQSSSSTAEAINQVRAKRPMSRMDAPSDIPTNDNQSDAEFLSCPFPFRVDKASNRSGEELDDDHPQSSSLSSKMISFELSNGHPHGPHVPITLDDKHYVEYQLDNLAGFPCSTEVEERMLMSAIMESIKDLNMQNQNQKEPESLGKEPQEPHDPIDSVATKAPAESTGLSKTNSASSSMVGGRSSAESRSMSTSSSGSDTDVPGIRKARGTVDKSPTKYVIDGLKRRWDFNFIRNNR